jgi:hypothetical protein
MFEKIIEKLDKPTIDNPSEEPVSIDLTAVNTLTERFEQVIEEVRKPTKVEHQHRHTVDIASSKVFLSLVIMSLMILGLSYIIGEQRKSISQFRNNDLKYRYIKMQGQANEENLYRLERQFRNSDSIKTIRRQVEKYEDLVREQAERIERAKQNSNAAEQLQIEAELLKQGK